MLSAPDSLFRTALRSGLGSALGNLDGAARHARGGSDRHPLAPSAVRVERTRSRRAGEASDQTAVTMWFGEAPGLPGMVAAGPALRSATRVGAGILGAAAIAAATTYVTKRDEQRLALHRQLAAPKRLSGPAPPADVVDQ
jgi:hypothetical protein